MERARIFHQSRTILRQLISKSRKHGGLLHAACAESDTRITPVLLVDLRPGVIISGWSCFVVFSEERSRGDVWQAATKSHPTPRAVPARSGKGFQTVWLLAPL